MKPLTEYEKNLALESGSGCAGHKKTHFRVEVGGVRLRKFVSVRLHHFHWDSRNRVEYRPGSLRILDFVALGTNHRTQRMPSG